MTHSWFPQLTATAHSLKATVSEFVEGFMYISCVLIKHSFYVFCVYVFLQKPLQDT